jgi:hypothetical protein
LCGWFAGSESALALFVTWVLADHTHHVVAADDLAGFAKAFDGSSDFHARNQRRVIVGECLVVVFSVRTTGVAG